MAAYIATHDRTVLPSQYDNSQVVMAQNVTHREILVLGHKLYHKSIEESENTRQSSMSQVEQRTWHLAQEEKQKALKESHEKHQMEMEKVKANAKKAQEKAVRAESKRVEALMKKIATQQLQQEREAADNKLTETIQRVKEQCDLMLSQAVEKATEDGHLHTMNEIQKVRLEEESKQEDQHQKLQQEKKEELAALKIKMEAECQLACQDMRMKCLKEHQSNVEEVKKIHSQEIDSLHNVLSQKDKKYSLLETEIDKLNDERKKVEKKLEEVIKGFQEFINTTKGFDPGQSEYLIPDIFRDYIQ